MQRQNSNNLCESKSELVIRLKEKQNKREKENKNKKRKRVMRETNDYVIRQ